MSTEVGTEDNLDLTTAHSAVETACVHGVISGAVAEESREEAVGPRLQQCGVDMGSKILATTAKGCDNRIGPLSVHSRPE